MGVWVRTPARSPETARRWNVVGAHHADDRSRLRVLWHYWEVHNWARILVFLTCFLCFYNLRSFASANFPVRNSWATPSSRYSWFSGSTRGALGHSLKSRIPFTDRAFGNLSVTSSYSPSQAVSQNRDCTRGEKPSTKTDSPIRQRNRSSCRCTAEIEVPKPKSV